MTEILFKDGVIIRRYSPTLKWILDSLYAIKDESGVEVITVTSINDSRHKVGSRHYSDEAMDIRSKNFLGPVAKRKFAALLTRKLNTHLTQVDKFVVIFEYEGTANEHFHVQPRKGVTFEG